MRWAKDMSHIIGVWVDLNLQYLRCQAKFIMLLQLRVISTCFSIFEQHFSHSFLVFHLSVFRSIPLTSTYYLGVSFHPSFCAQPPSVLASKGRQCIAQLSTSTSSDLLFLVKDFHVSFSMPLAVFEYELLRLGDFVLR